jgi:pilus assembly protein CpaF
LELHLDKIFPHRDIVAMKTNNIAGYSDVLVACMRQNPRWILLSEVRSAEAVMAVRNSISSGHNILSTIHSDSAKNVPMRMYSLLESNQEIDQFLKSIHRYVQIAIHVKGYMSQELGRFQREIVEVCEFYVTEDNEAGANIIYKKNLDGNISLNNPTKYLKAYMGSQGVVLKDNIFNISEDNIDSL